SHLVVVGASAGGIEALSMLVSTLNPHLKAPIVVAQHLDPHRTSHLQAILSQVSMVPVRTLSDREVLEPGVVFVVPANRHVAITDHDIALHQGQDGGSKPSIDLLLSSAAPLFGEDLIAVILTGTGSDGAAGALEVKKRGGTVIIQNPATAAFPALPASLSPAAVDIVADLDQIGPLLHELTTQSRLALDGAEEQSLRRLLDQLRERQGVDFQDYKMPTLLRRLQRRMLATGQDTLPEYLSYLQSHPQEYSQLVSTFLIKVTEFFRDPELFDYLRESVLPDIVEEARKRGNEIRLWSAGCATGEEPYSLAGLLTDVLGDELERFHIRIFATDLDADAVAFSRRGIYPWSALTNLPPDMISRYFNEVDGQYEVKKRLRSMVVFGEHDLADRAPFPRIDLLMCRNVLIYFTTELQRRVLHLFSFSLRDGGWLALGKAETVTPLGQYFVPDDVRLKIFRRRGDRAVLPARGVRDVTPMVQVRPPARPYLSVPYTPRLIRPDPTPPAPRQASDATVQHLPIGVVCVDRRYDIQTINIAARQLLGIHGPAIGDDLVHLAEEIPPGQLRASIDAAFRGETRGPLAPVESVDVASGQVRYLEISCYPGVPLENEPVDTVTVLIADVSRAMNERQALEGLVAQQRSELKESQERQRAELAKVQEQLQAVLTKNRELERANQELTAVNLELRSANEEFLLGNEELQAASEEVETLNEELQASNEELETLNEELQATVEELNTTNDDLEARSLELQDLTISLEAQRRRIEFERTRLAAVLVNMSDAVLVMRPSGETILTNAAYDRLFHGPNAPMAAEDPEGNPLPPDESPRQRASRGETFRLEFVVREADGSRRWFEAIGEPIRQDGSEAGGVVVIRDITDRSLRRLQDEFLALASHELRTPLTVVRASLGMLDRYLPADADDRLRRFIDMGEQQVRRMERLIADLVDVTRLQTGRLSLRTQPIDLVELARQTVDLAQAMTDEQTIELEAGHRPLTVDGDRDRLQQVLLNLLTNTIAHAPESKRVDVRVRRSGGEAEVVVQDYGPGIPQADLPNLFSRYFSGSGLEHDGDSGLGLGLFITDQLVRAHGGTIRADSQPGEGATFTVRLPLASPPER
ncbi:MAG: PAS domain S-box protein, partial [Chloroflexi bacterium]|nr:PAS domain S-box protein [Chloroflexota bacterium]